jgi:hypothetical protein
MNRAVMLGFAIALGMTGVVGAQTAPKPAGAPPAVTTPPLTPTARSAPALGAAAAAGPDSAAGVPLPRRPLDLRLGDLRRFFTPEELQPPVPGVIADEVLVEGAGGTDATPYGPPIPVGLVAPYWAATHPLSAWRIFLPDPNAVATPRY